MRDASKDIVTKVPLEVKLTDAELKMASKEMAEAINKRNRIEGEVETFKAQKKAELAAVEATISRCAVLVNSEKEFRLVECKVEYDFSKKGQKTFVRLDSGEVVRAEPITNEERQQMMPMPGHVDGKSKAAGE